MPDDKTKRGKRDRSQVSGGEGYEVSYFARKHGMPMQQAREMIQRIGNDREKLNVAASKVNGKKSGR